MDTRRNRPKSMERKPREDNRDTFSLASCMKKDTETWQKRCRRKCLKHLLIFLQVMALLVGICVGIALRFRKERYSARELMYLFFPGEIMVNMLNLLVFPLVMSSIISGLSLPDTWAVGKMSITALAYFLFTYFVSAVLGIVFATSIFPREERKSKQMKTNKLRTTVLDSVLDFLRQLIPSNMVEATFQKPLTALREKTIYKAIVNPPSLTGHATNITTMATSVTKIVPEPVDVSGASITGIIVMSVVGGILINWLGDRGLPLRVFFDAIFEVTMELISIVNWYTPVGVFFLVVAHIVEMQSSTEVLEQTSFFITVIAAMLIHSLFVLPLICFVICRRNPYIFMKKIVQVMLTAIGTSSSLATLPITIKCLEDPKMKLDPRTVGFVAPIGASMNKDGSAMFNIIAIIFLGNAQGLELSFFKIIYIGFLSIIAAMSTPGVPQGDLILMDTVLQATGITTSKQNILVLDWILDRFRTSTNVLSDAYGCAVVYHLTKDDMQRMDAIENEDDSPAFLNSVFQSEAKVHTV